MACHCEEGSCHCEEGRSKKTVIVFAARIALSLALALLGHFLLSEERVGLGWNLFVMLVAYAIIGYDILYKAFRNLFIEHEWFDECALMVLASSGAFALRAYGPDHNEFLEAVLVILLYQVGEFFQDLAADASRDAIVASLDLRKEKAMVERDGRLLETEAEDLRQGDVVRVSAGVKIQCDGLILEGQGHVDESSLTGEAYPVFKAKGDAVVSGTLLSEGSLRVQVTADFENSTSARLIHLIEEGAFMSCKMLEEIQLPASLKSVDKGAFAQCVNLRKVILNASLQQIGAGAFCQCRSLREVQWNDSLKTIGDEAFLECKYLRTPLFPEHVKIGKNAFKGCTIAARP